MLKKYCFFLLIVLYITCVEIIPSQTVYGVDTNLVLDVTTGSIVPPNVTFVVTNPEPPPPYYTGTPPVSVTSSHVNTGSHTWYLGIRAAAAYLVDITDTSNRIPISELQWSVNGTNYYSLSTQWAYLIYHKANHNARITDNITYRLNGNTNASAGNYTVQIEFDARWSNPNLTPWN